MKRATNSQLQKYGREIAYGDFTHLDDINYWRMLHARPLNLFAALLRKRVKRRGNDAVIIAQRLKRMPTIISKINRYPGMNLARMQDIGGARLVLPTARDVRLRQKQYNKNIGSRFVLVRQHDYISGPKPDGYRGIHIVYQYISPGEESDGLFIEFQIRSELQHNWATAVETVGTFINKKLKEGEKETVWNNFFELISVAFAYVENESVPEKYKDGFEGVCKKIKLKNQEYDFLNRLQAFAVAGKSLNKKTHSAQNVILSLDFKKHIIKAEMFGAAEEQKAIKQYEQLEKRDSSQFDQVLISVDSIKKLESAYPNYFLNMSSFIDKVQILLQTLENRGDDGV